MKELIEGLMINKGINEDVIMNNRYTLLTSTSSSGDDK